MQMSGNVEMLVDNQLRGLSAHFEKWDKTRDMIDNLIDLILNYRQSGHPGGSRSKVYALLSLLLSGAMRWDIRHPEKRFGDRFILGSGHAIPLIYCTLAVLNEAMRIRFEQTGKSCYALPENPRWVLTWQDLINFRRRGGLSGHAEMEGKTLFLKFNTGPSGHGSPAAVGEALALKRAGAPNVRVFFMEGEGGLTPGGNYEAFNSAWGLAVDNLYHIIDWNDFGIDDHPVSSSVYGAPAEWYKAHGWRTFGSDFGDNWEAVTKTLLSMVTTANPDRQPSMSWLKSRKGRGYLKYDNASHGAPHAMNSEIFWETKRPFAEKYNVTFQNFGCAAPSDSQALQAEFAANLEAVISVLRSDQSLVEYLSDRLVELGDSVPQSVETFRLGKGNPYRDERISDFHNYPADLYAAPGSKVANRTALAKWGAWVNAFGAKHYGRPIFLAASADLAASTNLSGFGGKYEDFPGYSWYERFGSSEGALLPQEITEFANIGLLAGAASVNLSEQPEKEFEGFWGITSTYGSFSYLKYGMMRLFSQIAQDCQLKMGKIVYVAGHSGPETADDSRTHFGIFSPGVTQLFPKGHIINLHPWEHNEVPVLLGAALRQKAPLIALHLTRPPIEIPDRQALGIPSHFEAARGAYVARDYTAGLPRHGTVIVQGTSAMANLIKIFPEMEKRQINLKIVYAASPQLFDLQDDAYQNTVLSRLDRLDSMVITTQARWLMHDWIYNKENETYALSSDWDNRWRTGGTVDEVLEEAHLTPAWILQGLERFAGERKERLRRMKSEIDQL